MTHALVKPQSTTEGTKDGREWMLHPDKPKRASSKRLVCDFLREEREGAQMGLADRYLTAPYMPPNVGGGRAGLVSFFSTFAHPKPIARRVKAPLIATVADGDHAIATFVKPAAVAIP